MKGLFLILLAACPLVGQAFEWEGAIRENYITKASYSYNSDSYARVLYELVQKGHKKISLHPRLAWAGDQKSLFYFPVIKTSMAELAISNTRILQADAEMTLKPILFENPGEGEAKPATRIRPARPDLALTSYNQLIAQFTKLTRRHDVGTLVVGSGLVHLLANETLIPRFEALLKDTRKSKAPATKVLLEVVGDEDLEALSHAVKHAKKPLRLAGLIDGISMVVNPETHFPNGNVDIDELRKTRMMLEALLPTMPIHLARVVVPGCEKPYTQGEELYCSGTNFKHQLQVERLQKLRQVLLTLEEEGMKFKTVEILEANTYAEPETPDARYPFYNPIIPKLNLYDLPVSDNITSPALPLPKSAATKTACIYYDKVDTLIKQDKIGEVHAMMLQSVLGAFPQWKVVSKEIGKYKKKEYIKCQAIFYLGTNFNQELPESFLEEMANAVKTTPVAWLNYKIASFAQAMKERDKDLGFDAQILIQADSTPSINNQNPGFYSQFDYKGETFFKVSKWNPIANTFESSPEIHKVEISSPEKVEVLSYARHDKTDKKTPYAVKSENLWYLADSPFSYVHYEDRFYIFCDLLWDILGETAPKERIALVRIEDVNPTLPDKDFKWVSDYLGSNKIPYSIALIPFLSNIFGTHNDSHKPTFSPITKFPSFVGQLKYAINRGADIVMHGTAHSVGCLMSGYDGISGADYEFWLYPQNTPLPFDSVDWVTRRLELGIKVLQDLKITPAAFEAPHYAASVLDYLIFSKMFKWHYHRSIFVSHDVLKDTGLPKHLQAFECKPSECGDERRRILNNIQVKADYSSFSGIASPFITHKDVYGQAIIPETLGMVDFAFYPKETWRPISTPDDILRRAKKLKVIRGAVASFFWHPLLLNPKSLYYVENPGSFEKIGGKHSLPYIIEGLKELGYEFKSITDETLFPNEV